MPCTLVDNGVLLRQNLQEVSIKTREQNITAGEPVISRTVWYKLNLH